MEAITDLKHILHRGRGKYITKNDGSEALVGNFYLLNFLNRITIKRHLLEKTNSTNISIPFVFSHIFTSNRANIFYCLTFHNRLNQIKLRLKIKKNIANRSNSTCLDKGSNCGENTIVKSTQPRNEQFNRNQNTIKQWHLFSTIAHDNLATTCSQIRQQAVAQLRNKLFRNCENFFGGMILPFFVSVKTIQNPFINMILIKRQKKMLVTFISQFEKNSKQNQTCALCLRQSNQQQNMANTNYK